MLMKKMRVYLNWVCIVTFTIVSAFFTSYSSSDDYINYLTIGSLITIVFLIPFGIIKDKYNRKYILLISNLFLFLADYIIIPHRHRKYFILYNRLVLRHVLGNVTFR